MQPLSDIKLVAPALEKYPNGPVAQLWKRPGLSPRDRSINPKPIAQPGKAITSANVANLSRVVIQSLLDLVAVNGKVGFFSGYFMDCASRR